jgi:hypothetical protein
MKKYSLTKEEIYKLIDLYKDLNGLFCSERDTELIIKNPQKYKTLFVFINKTLHEIDPFNCAYDFYEYQGEVKDIVYNLLSNEYTTEEQVYLTVKKVFENRFWKDEKRNDSYKKAASKIFKFIKNNWYERIAFKGKVVKFHHFYEYNEWLEYIKKQKTVFSLIQSEKMDEVLNKAINHEKVLNSEFDDLLIVCHKSKIMFVFNKKSLKIKTILDFKKSKAKKYFCEKIEKIDFGFVSLDDKSWVESFADFSDIYYMCDDVVWLNSI